MEKNISPLGQAIRALRLKEGLSRQQMAGYLQVSPSSVASYESGRRAPSLKVWTRLCASFHVEPWFRQQDPGREGMLDISFLTAEQKSMVMQLVSSMGSRP